MKRRDFIKYTTAAVAGLWVGSKMPPWAKDHALAQVVPDQTISMTFTDARKQMVTSQGGRAPNVAECYFWILKASIEGPGPAVDLPANVPGPNIFAFEGDTIAINLFNNLDADHRLAIPALNALFATSDFTSATLNAGQQNVPFVFELPAGSAGTYLYYDDLNQPVNRVMGLHGALIVMPAAAANPETVPPPALGKITPYSPAPANIQALFNALGEGVIPDAPFPGLAWEESAVNPGGAPELYPDTPRFRQYIWLLHQASPVLFAAVGNNAPVSFTDQFTGGTVTGNARDPNIFVQAFLNSKFTPGGKNKPPAVDSLRPEFFTMQGQSGHFSHNTPAITPHLRVGEPCVIRCLNAGLWNHSMHIHANHVYVLRVTRNTGSATAPVLQTAFNAFQDLPGGVDVVDNPPWVDTYTSKPLDVWDWLTPYIRPPDVANTRGIGLQDPPLAVDPRPVKTFGSLPGRVTPNGVSTWPPVQELDMAIPRRGTVVRGVPIHVPLSPLCFPMHDHSEPSQTTQGGNYNTGLIAGINFIGDRNLPPGQQTFPNAPITFLPATNPGADPADLERAVFGPSETGTPAGPFPPFEEQI